MSDQNSGGAAGDDDPFAKIEYVARPLHFIWLVDCSGSMAVENKMQALNAAIEEAIPHVAEVAEDNPEAQVLMRAIKFSNGAHWHVKEPTPVGEFTWPSLSATGHTDMGAAFKLVADTLDNDMPKRALQPVLVLVTDGYAVDDVNEGFERLMQSPWGERAVRASIAIGDEVDKSTLEKFRSKDIPVLYAHNPQELVHYIRWVSMVTTQTASQTNVKKADPAGAGAGAAETPEEELKVPPPLDPVWDDNAAPEGGAPDSQIPPAVW